MPTASHTNRISWSRRRAQKLIVEIKAKNEMSDPIVQAKARAAGKWVSYANAHAAEIGGKPWVYALVPHDMVGPSATLAGLIARYGMTISTAAVGGTISKNT